jgi:diadenylate cyclase
MIRCGFAPFRRRFAEDADGRRYTAVILPTSPGLLRTAHRTMLTNLDQLFRSYELWQVAIELAVIWICVYLIFRFLHGTRGAGVIKGFAILLVIGTLFIRVLSQGTDAFARLDFIYSRFLGLVAILLVVVFQPELRQAMIRLGHAWTFRSSRESMHGVVHAVTDAVSFLSKNQFGALIAIERSSRLGGLIESGVHLDAQVSARLLECIFWPNSPLHDLGVIVRGDRIIAASVQFPLAEEGLLPPNFGSRHRAAAGLSLESDCVVVVVSEETGAISIAEHGRLRHDISRDEFPALLATRLRTKPTEEASTDDSDEESTDGDTDEKQAA